MIFVPTFKYCINFFFGKNVLECKSLFPLIVIDRFDDSYLRLGRKTNEQLGRNWESQTSEET